LLLHLNCQIGPKNQSSSFIHAAKNGRTDIVKLLIDANISPSAYSDALCASVKRGHLKTVQLLIDSNADPSTQNNLPFRIARDNQHPEIVTYLLNFPEVSKNNPPPTTPNSNPGPTPSEAFVQASIGSVRTVQGKDRYTEYEILVKTNIPMLAKGKSSIMIYRRYSQFVKFFKVMNNYILSSSRYQKVLPTIGSEDYFSRFENEIIEKRKEKLQQFMDAICGDSQLRCVTHLVQFIDPYYEYPVK